MSLKEKINKKRSQIKDYKAAVAYYREVLEKFRQAEKEITVHVEEEQVANTVACIKNYLIELPEDLFDAGEKEYPETTKCPHFHEKPCLVYDCPFQKKNMEYRNQQLLLSQARNSKQAALRVLFQRIR